MELQKVLEQLPVLLHGQPQGLALECTGLTAAALRAFCAKELPGLGMCLPEEGLYARMTAREYLELFRRLGGRGKTAPALEALGLADLAGVRVGKLTAGQRRRLGFAREAVKAAPLLYLEEPLAGLDEAELRRVLAWLDGLGGHGVKFIAATASTRTLHLLPGAHFRLDGHGLCALDGDAVPGGAAPEVRVEKIPARADGRLYLFNPAEIDWLESRDGRVELHIRDDVFQCPLTLDALTERLGQYGFFRCHRSYLVNMQKVRQVVQWTRSSYSLQLEGGGTGVPLSKNRIAEMKQQYHF